MSIAISERIYRYPGLGACPRKVDLRDVDARPPHREENSGGSIRSRRQRSNKPIRRKRSAGGTFRIPASTATPLRSNKARDLQRPGFLEVGRSNRNRAIPRPDSTASRQPWPACKFRAFCTDLRPPLAGVIELAARRGYDARVGLEAPSCCRTAPLRGTRQNW
jgi:hypothetical protein